MGSFDNFINSDQNGCEKVHGIYGCKFCDNDVDHAWWDSNKGMFFWLCSNGHRSEMTLV